MSAWKIVLRWVGGMALAVVVYAAVGLAWACRHDRSPSGFPMGEYVTPNEDFVTAQIIASAIDLSMGSRDKLIDGKLPLATDAKTAPGFRATDYRRDVHAKSHGCVLASFTVLDKLRDNLAVGIFSKPATYDAIIRFSSGKPELNPDSVPDARGFALKVLGVPGQKLLPGEEDAQSQDFIMINSTVFFIRTIDEYLQFSKALGQGKAATRAYFFPAMLEPWKSRPREFLLAISSFKKMPDSMATETYYSLSAYRLGPRQYVKYSARPCKNNRPMLPSSAKHEQDSFDYLRKELAIQAEKGEACFDLMVQLQVAGKDMPVEDATVDWSEKDSPFIPVARITFKKQANNTAEMNQTCENLSFNPWHSLPEHEPVGVMNRVRKALYQSMGNYRRTKNCQELCTTACAKGGPNGESCTPGCSNACLAKCPLLNEPPGLALPENMCRAPAVAEENAERLSFSSNQ